MLRGVFRGVNHYFNPLQFWNNLNSSLYSSGVDPPLILRLSFLKDLERQRFLKDLDPPDLTRFERKYFRLTRFER